MNNINIITALTLTTDTEEVTIKHSHTDDCLEYGCLFDCYISVTLLSFISLRSLDPVGHERPDIVDVLMEGTSPHPEHSPSSGHSLRYLIRF